MVKLLLEIGYDASVSYGAARIFPGNDGKLAHDEVNRALLEIIYRMTDDEKENGNSDDTYEIIRLLISQGGANPHINVSIRFPGKPHTQGDRMLLLRYLKGKMTQEDTPLSAAARVADAEAVRCMINAYSSSLGEFKTQRRNDPLLQSQPESYFQKLEEKEDDTVYWSVDAALVISLFMMWQTAQNKYGRCALVLYKRDRLNLSCNAVPRNLSQRAMQWLEKCLEMCLLLPPPKQKSKSTEGCYFQAPLVQHHIPNIPNCMGKKSIPYQNAGANFMDWSRVLTDLPWFRSRTYGVTCNWMQENSSDSSEVKEVNYNRTISEDEFYLVVEGEQLLAHKSIVSAKSGKLAAQIRFTEKECLLGDRLSVHIDHLPLLAAKMLLSHCYHNSIAFGLRKSPIKQCHQLLELALLAEEYLCPSLLLECELRLLLQSSSHGEKGCGICICPHCSGETVFAKEQMNCPIGLQCLEKAKVSNDTDGSSSYCEPVGVYTYKTSAFSMLSSQIGSLVTPESALDILAVAQQLESSSSQQGIHRIKFWRSETIDNPNSTFGGWNRDADKDIGCTSAPFAAAKMMAISIMLRNFPEVVRSDSYLRQIKSDNDEDHMAEVDAPFTTGTQAGYDEHAILLLQT
eukprot:CAMPEP_0172327472 /NCGR_PEP_ID=MMETSP1058-20130122/59675_1 /TAXON_ID=83371 /ORGANISM="Detonula confervacea, Strain CCMP 353" /LENGTH=627 /DNA_ID=CAMNT_0013044537 /DNA_START=151 /DNA_END=2031 /DNA_ORIENTATION=-